MTEPLYRVYEQQEVGGRYFNRLTLAQAQKLFSNMVKALQLAENLAFDACMRYHRNRLTLSTSDVDQLRTYDVVDRGENFVILYKNGMDAGKSTIYATINKETCKVCSTHSTKWRTTHD